MPDRTLPSGTEGVSRLEHAQIAELAVTDPESEGWFGNGPWGRQADAGHVATTAHATCHECFMPVPEHLLDTESVCADCTGAAVYETWTGLPSREDYLV